MSSNKNYIAKDIFVKYLGNKYFMELAGELKHYNAYRITEEEETLWRNDLINQLFFQLSNSISNYEYIMIHSDLSQLVTKLNNPQIENHFLEETIKKIKSVDAYTKLRLIINVIDNVIHHNILNQKSLSPLEQRTINLMKLELKNMLESSISVDDSYKDKIDADLLTGIFIKEYAKNKLDLLNILE